MKKTVWCWYKGGLYRLQSVHNCMAVIRPRFGEKVDRLVSIREISFYPKARRK